MTDVNLALVDLMPPTDWIRLVPGFFELGPSDLSQVVDRDRRDEEGNLVIAATDGTVLSTAQGVRADELHSPLLPELEPRLAEAVAVGASIIVPAVRIADGGGGHYNVMAFMPDGELVSMDGCLPPIHYEIVPQWRNEQALGLTDLEAWQAVVRTGSPEAESFDVWASARALTSDEAAPPWSDRPAGERQLNTQDTPAEVLGNLDTGILVVDFGGQWDALNAVVCARLDIAWGECGRTDARGAFLDGWHEQGKGFEIWLMSEPRLSRAAVLLAEIDPSLASSLGATDSAGSEQIVLIRAASPASSVEEVVERARRGERLLTIELTTLDEYEASFTDPPKPENPEGP